MYIRKESLKNAVFTRKTKGRSTKIGFHLNQTAAMHTALYRRQKHGWTRSKRRKWQCKWKKCGGQKG